MHLALPSFLQTRLQEVLSDFRLSTLSHHAQELTAHYKSNLFTLSESTRMAYLAVRFPATYAVIRRVLEEISTSSFTSFLDVGSGPGTGMWAAKEVFPYLKVRTLLEKDRGFISLGKRLAKEEDLQWQEGDITRLSSLKPHDLVLLSYVIGEIPEEKWEKILALLVPATQKMMVWIEPGTPEGFRRLEKIKAMLLALSFSVLAPCPHQHACPLAKGDWCHFAQRLDRSSLHRKVKRAELSYEDEKYSYLIVSKQKQEEASWERIIRRPRFFPGHVSLQLCTAKGIVSRSVSKKEKEYKKVKKAKWGDKISLGLFRS